MCTCNPLAGYRCPEHRTGTVASHSTAPDAPPPPSTGVPAVTELTVEQMIRLTALDRAITFAQYRDGLEDPPGWVLAAAARFEAYIRDGVA